MASLKRLLKSALEDRSPRFTLATIALAVVSALLAGTLIGYKLDSSSGSSGTKVAKATAAKKRPARRISGGATAAPLLIGSVVKSVPRLIVVQNAQGTPVRLAVGGKTRVEITQPSTVYSIVPGSKVLYAASPTSPTTASAIVVLPATSSAGTPVTSVVPGNSMTIPGSVVITTSSATVLTTKPGIARSITAGSKVAAVYFHVPGTNGAVELVVLPTASAF